MVAVERTWMSDNRKWSVELVGNYSAEHFEGSAIYSFLVEDQANPAADLITVVVAVTRTADSVRPYEVKSSNKLPTYVLKNCECIVWNGRHQGFPAAASLTPAEQDDMAADLAASLGFEYARQAAPDPACKRCGHTGFEPYGSTPDHCQDCIDVLYHKYAGGSNYLDSPEIIAIAERIEGATHYVELAIIREDLFDQWADARLPIEERAAYHYAMEAVARRIKKLHGELPTGLDYGRIIADAIEDSKLNASFPAMFSAPAAPAILIVHMTEAAAARYEDGSKEPAWCEAQPFTVPVEIPADHIVVKAAAMPVNIIQKPAAPAVDPVRHYGVLVFIGVEQDGKVWSNEHECFEDEALDMVQRGYPHEYVSWTFFRKVVTARTESSYH